MLQFIIIMIILDILMRIKVGQEAEAVETKPANPGKAYVMGNQAEWEFRSLDDAMEYREMRLSGWKGNAKDYYEWKEEA